MSEYSWIEHMLRAEGFTISPKLQWFLSAEPAVITPFDLEEEEYAIRNMAKLQEQFPTLKCVPFARRLDRDDLFVIVLQDPVYKRGQVIFVDIEDVNRYFLEDSYLSLDVWMDDVWAQLEEVRAAKS